MTTTEINTASAEARAQEQGLNDMLDLFLAERAHGMNAYELRQDRMASLRRLNAMSDDQLAGLDLARKDIPAFVFEDILPG